MPGGVDGHRSVAGLVVGPFEAWPFVFVGFLGGLLDTYVENTV